MGNMDELVSFSNKIPKLYTTDSHRIMKPSHLKMQYIRDITMCIIHETKQFPQSISYVLILPIRPTRAASASMVTSPSINLARIYPQAHL